jgi:NADH-quinone oxidoreductase subunit C
MLPENLKEYATATALEAFDSDALQGGKFDRGELTLEIAREKIVAVCRFLKENRAFTRVSTITGVDRYPDEPRFEVVYHLQAVERSERLRLKCRLPAEDAAIDSVTEIWRGANWYERETFDLFGVNFRHHPDLRRIMLPDEWEGHPLRKDYSVMGPRA